MQLLRRTLDELSTPLIKDEINEFYRYLSTTYLNDDAKFPPSSWALALSIGARNGSKFLTNNSLEIMNSSLVDQGINNATELSTVISIANGFKSESFSTEIAKLESNSQQKNGSIEEAIVSVGFGLMRARSKAESLKSTQKLRHFINNATQPETAVFQNLIKESTADSYQFQEAMPVMSPVRDEQETAGEQVDPDPFAQQGGEFDLRRVAAPIAQPVQRVERRVDEETSNDEVDVPAVIHEFDPPPVDSLPSDNEDREPENFEKSPSPIHWERLLDKTDEIDETIRKQFPNRPSSSESEQENDEAGQANRSRPTSDSYRNFDDRTSPEKLVLSEPKQPRKYIRSAKSAKQRKTRDLSLSDSESDHERPESSQNTRSLCAKVKRNAKKSTYCEHDSPPKKKKKKTEAEVRLAAQIAKEKKILKERNRKKRENDPKGYYADIANKRRQTIQRKKEQNEELIAELREELEKMKAENAKLRKREEMRKADIPDDDDLMRQLKEVLATSDEEDF
ncbi:Oidioi.mRNA.OKI2018_I69.PAR.g12010.t1.cds [Oikopleura dioica]|uniref:Oidioi.mRNA.OKI2018_I69.PAR.g12010.t1.cds n=1 Tax=Oikopleura dioica TaxID=34765 RepID=A0ABN7RYE7_OIKDI|nr:Oidioi.mRNA.OKI2018_I69.PAR.g12010.t1.cds [Oikopleura dioica]